MAKTRIAEAKVKAATSHGWDHWFQVLDDLNFQEIGHQAAAKILHQYHVSNFWWCQTIAIEYAIARGLRDPNQTSTGTFSTSASRTVSTPPDQAWNAIPIPTQLNQQVDLPNLHGQITKSTPPKLLRIDTPTQIRYEFTIMTVKDKTRLTVTALKLPTANDVAPQKPIVTALADDWKANLP